MPQFDFFSWMSMGFWTVLSFHFFYLYVVKQIVSPFSEIQKSALKLNWLLNRSFLYYLRIRVLRVVFSIRKVFFFKALGPDKVLEWMGVKTYPHPQKR